jgi:sodium-dependent dicarboxylate transporter 2/3/5
VTEVETPGGRSAFRNRLGLALAPVLFIGLLAAPLPLETPAHRLAAIFAAVLVLWVTEAIPVAATALLIAPLLAVTSVTDAREAFRHYADPLLYLFVGGFFIAEAMQAHGLDRRIAEAVVRTAKGRAGRVRAAMMMAGVVLSMWISNTATTAILLPIFLGMARRAGTVAVTGGVLAIAYACSVGGLGTLVGSPPNLITFRLLAEAEHELTFLDWVAVGLPTAILVVGAIHLVLARTFPVDEGRLEVGEADDSPRPWTRGEVVTALAFGLAATGWVVPGVVNALGLEGAAELKRLLHPGVVAILASSVLFVFDDGAGERVLTWRRATQIDWGIVLLFGGGIALGQQLVETGLAGVLSRGFITLTGIETLWSLTAVCCVFTIFFTEVCSNTASANMLVPLALTIASELGVSPVPPALAVGLAASCAFMLPIATGPNAIAYSTGRVSQPTMIRVGLVLNLIAAVLVFGVLRVLCPLYGWV